MAVLELQDFKESILMKATTETTIVFILIRTFFNLLDLDLDCPKFSLDKVYDFRKICLCLALVRL